ncbi:hypothetical protein ABZ413_33360 [Nocardia rhamnosiphila]|uniref:hypothetical protein n=1 Tax=Nocardia rhamnosiphila TaxID=426716 RepID=UPI0033EC1658
MTLMVAAVAAGATAGLGGAAERAITDSYQAIKQLIARRYASVDVEVVERAPDSFHRRAVLAEELQDAGAGEDEELQTIAGRLLVAVHRHAPAAAGVVGVELREIRAGELAITDIASTGTGVVVESATVGGAITISSIRADSGYHQFPPPAQ